MKRTDSSVIFRPNRELDDAALLSASSDALVVTAGGESWTAIAAVATSLDRSGWLGRGAAFGLRFPGVHAIAGLAAGCQLPKSTS